MRLVHSFMQLSLTTSSSSTLLSLSRSMMGNNNNNHATNDSSSSSDNEQHQQRWLRCVCWRALGHYVGHFNLLLPLFFFFTLSLYHSPLLFPPQQPLPSSLLPLRAPFRALHSDFTGGFYALLISRRWHLQVIQFSTKWIRCKAVSHATNIPRDAPRVSELCAAVEQ